VSACSPKVVRTKAIPPPAPVQPRSPARDAQEQLLQEAYRAFKERRYQAAALFFQRFTDVARDSPRLAEAHWWLGRCFESLGDFSSAMGQYRLVASGSLSRQRNGARYEGQAVRRLDDLYNLRVVPRSRSAARLAVRFRADQLPPMTHLSAWFQDLAKNGVVAVVVAPAIPGREGSGFELVREMVAEANRRGMLLWVALDLHQGHGMEIRPEWKTATVNPAQQDGRVLSGADVAHPAYQSYLEGIMEMLARTGCDGVLLTARSASGFAEEFTDESLQQFAASLGRSVSPRALWNVGATSDGRATERSPEYWRWVGWKARSYGQLVKRLRLVLREHHHTATLAVEVHQSSVTAPVEGLKEFGEDVAELATQSGWSVVVRREGQGWEEALKKLGRLAGVPDRVWVEEAVKTGTGPLVMKALRASIVEKDSYGRWNMLVEIEPVTAVP